MAKLISDISALDLIVLDYEANAWKENLLRKTLRDFIGILRAKHTYVPILVVSKLPYADEVFEREKAGIRKSNIEFQKNLVNTLQEQGDRYIYFLDGSGLLGNNFNECMAFTQQIWDFTKSPGICQQQFMKYFRYRDI